MNLRDSPLQKVGPETPEPHPEKSPEDVDRREPFPGQLQQSRHDAVELPETIDESGDEDDRTAGPGERFSRANGQLPARVMDSIRIEPVRMLPLGSTSLPTATSPRNMSLRLPAMVISSTGYWITPFSTQKPAAPRE